jgi:NADPH-dependent glutamate synthase beta subunit-like oxidoreductase
MRENVEKYIELIIGSILLSLGIYLFVTPNGINFGGAIGIAQIIEYFIVKMVPSPAEIKACEKEGVKIAFLNNIKDILKDENGNVCGVQVAKMELGEMDESGRASCHEVKDSLFTIDCDLVAMAIGQKVDFTPLNDNLKTTDTHASTLDNVFIIGDAFTGPKTIGSAVMEGKKIAKEIEAKYNEGAN